MATSESVVHTDHTLNLPKDILFKIGIVHTKWNGGIVQSLLKACKEQLLKNRVQEDDILELEVPGSFELPFGARNLAQKDASLDAIICLGCVIQGDTKHDDYINHSVSNALMGLSLTTGIPHIFGVLTTNDKNQALARSGGLLGNRGIEYASTALIMACIKRGPSKKRIGFS